METVADAFAAHERLLWGLGYRMTGVASDADEIVQETFLRVIEHPLPDDGRPLRPWLVRVCANLARDRLRARRRRGGSAVWLPSPVPSERLVDSDAEGRYNRAESAGVAFLLALEALTPTQRAVLLLRDVFDLDADEAARALGSTPGAVRAAHHKARRALAAARGGPEGAGASPDAAHLTALSGFLGALAAGDAAAALAFLAPEVVLRSDGGGVYQAARVPVRGAEKVVRFLLSVTSDPGETRWAVRALNGTPMVLVELVGPTRGRAPRSVIGATLDGAGRIVAIHWMLDPGKLTAVAGIEG